MVREGRPYQCAVLRVKWRDIEIGAPSPHPHYSARCSSCWARKCADEVADFAIAEMLRLIVDRHQTLVDNRKRFDASHFGSYNYNFCLR